MSCIPFVVVSLLVSSFALGQLLQGSACIGAIRESDVDSDRFLTIAEFSLLAAFSDDGCINPSITDSTRFNTLSDGTASISIQVAYLNPPGFIEESLMNVVCVNAFSSPYVCQAPVASPTPPAPVGTPPASQPQTTPAPQPQTPAPIMPTVAETFPGCFDALEFSDSDNTNTLDFDEFLVLVGVILDCSSLRGAPVRTFYENALCLCPNGTPQCCNINREIDITNNQNRICIEAYSLRLFATVNPAGCPDPTPAPTRRPTFSPSSAPVSKMPTRAPLPTNQPIAPTTRQPIVGTALPTETPPTDFPTTLSPTLTFVSDACLDRLDDADANNDGFIDIAEFPILATGRACEIIDWGPQGYELFQALANCAPNCPIISSTSIPLQDRTEFERICSQSTNAVRCITDPPTQSPTTLEPTISPTVTPPTATTPCEQAMRNADADDDQRLSLAEFKTFLFRLADCRSPTNAVIEETIFATAGCNCRILRDPACCSSVEFVDISVLFQPRNDTTIDYIIAVCTASQAINAFVDPNPGQCPPTGAPIVRLTPSPVLQSTQAPVLQSTQAPVGFGTSPTAPPVSPVTRAPTQAPIDSAPRSLCESSLRLGNANGDQIMTADEYAVFLFYLGECTSILINAAFVQAFQTSISSCLVFGRPECINTTNGIDIAAVYEDINLRTSAQSGQINTICSIGFGALASGRIIDSSIPAGCTESPTESPIQSPTQSPTQSPPTQSPVTAAPTSVPTLTISSSPTLEVPDAQLESCVALIRVANTISDNYLNPPELLALANELSTCPIRNDSILIQLLFSTFACDCATDLLCCSDGIAKIDVTGFQVPFSLRTIPQRRQLESLCASLFSIVAPEGAVCPTAAPITAPTPLPTFAPTSLPTKSPTFSPTKSPTETPTTSPTETPTRTPIDQPTNFPVRSPTIAPQTFAPIVNGQPTNFPIDSSTTSPVEPPTNIPTVRPALSPTNPISTFEPMQPPFMAPTISPIQAPVLIPSPNGLLTERPIPPVQPTPFPAPQSVPSPVQQPTPFPVQQPTPFPVQQPTPFPVQQPAPFPVQQPAPFLLTQPPVPQPSLPNTTPFALPEQVPLPVVGPVFVPVLFPLPVFVPSVPIPAPVPVSAPVVVFSVQDCLNAIRLADEDSDSILGQDEYQALIVALSGCELVSRLSEAQLEIFQELACLCLENDQFIRGCCVVSQQRVFVDGASLPLEDLSLDQRSALEHVCDRTRTVIPPDCAPSPSNAPTSQPVDPNSIPVPTPMMPANQSPISPMTPPSTIGGPLETPSMPIASQPILPPRESPTRTNAPIILIREATECRDFLDEQIATANSRLTKSSFFEFVEQLSGCRYNDNDLPIPLRAAFDELSSSAGGEIVIDLRGGADTDRRFVNRRARICHEIIQAIGGTTCVDDEVTDLIVVIQENELQVCSNAIIDADNGDEQLERSEFIYFLSLYGGCEVDSLDFGSLVSFYNFACNCEGADGFFPCCFPVASINVSGVALRPEQRSPDQLSRLSQLCSVASGLTTNQTSCEAPPETPDPSIGDKECSDFIVKADADANERLGRDEFLRFLQLRFPDKCSDIEKVPHYQSIVFNIMACACLFEEIGNLFCCLPQSASVHIPGANTSVSERSRYERAVIATICEATRVAADFGCMSRPSANESSAGTNTSSTNLLKIPTPAGSTGVSNSRGPTASSASGRLRIALLGLLTMAVYLLN